MGLNPIALSDVATWGDKSVCSELAKKLGLLVELTPFRRFNESLVDENTVAFHGSPFVTESSFWNRIRFGPRSEIPLILLWQAIIGPFFKGPGERIARARRIPIILHQDQILELAEEAKLEKLIGLKVSLENSNFNHPLNQGDLERGFFRAVEYCRDYVSELDLVIDLEHLAAAKWPQVDYDFCKFLEQSRTLAPIAEFHICDWIASESWRGHLVPGQGTASLREQLACIAHCFPKALVVLEHSPTIGKLAFLRLSRARRIASVLPDIEKAYSVVSSALSI